MENSEGNHETQNQIEEEPKEEVKIIDPLSYIPSMPILTNILGDKFIDNKSEPVTDIETDIFSVKLMGIFFNGEWGSPSRIFRKSLVDVYNKTNDGEKVFEIIEVECPKQVKEKAVVYDQRQYRGKSKEEADELKAKEEEMKRNAEKKLEDEFKRTVSLKPWKFLPYKDKRADILINRYNVTSIPQFFPIDKNGNIISDNARLEILEGGADVCEEWINVLHDIYEQEQQNNNENNKEENNKEENNKEENNKEENIKVENNKEENKEEKKEEIKN